jgi:hypothetical protein
VCSARVTYDWISLFRLELIVGDITFCSSFTVCVAYTLGNFTFEAVGNGIIALNLLLSSVVVFLGIGWVLYNKSRFCLRCHLNMFLYIYCSEISL